MISPCETTGGDGHVFPRKKHSFNVGCSSLLPGLTLTEGHRSRPKAIFLASTCGIFSDQFETIVTEESDDIRIIEPFAAEEPIAQRTRRTTVHSYAHFVVSDVQQLIRSLTGTFEGGKRPLAQKGALRDRRAISRIGENA